MKANTRFPVAVHILALAAMNNSTPNTSELLARSVNTNPVVIRRTVALLKKAGLVEVRPGVGGLHLLRLPEQVTLLDVYNAVKEAKRVDVFPLHQNPCQKCYVGRSIHAALNEPLRDAQEAMENRLAAHTMAEVIEKIRNAS